MQLEPFPYPLKPFSLNINGRIHLFNEAIVMGILNITDDSFFDGGKFIDLNRAMHQVRKMANEGATIIDVGASSSRPGSVPVDVDIELSRLLPVIERLKDELPDVIISVDTFRSKVAMAVIDNGAHIINDITAGDEDVEMLPCVAEMGIPYIAMHKKGSTTQMQHNPQYHDVSAEVIEYFNDKLTRFKELGINDVILDPGFGFGKKLTHNYELLRNLPSIGEICGRPMLVGVSRKSMINNLLNIKAKDALNGTTAVHTLALISGASILRVHDVREAVEAIRICKAYFEIADGETGDSKS